MRDAINRYTAERYVYREGMGPRLGQVWRRCVAFEPLQWLLYIISIIAVFIIIVISNITIIKLSSL